MNLTPFFSSRKNWYCIISTVFSIAITFVQWKTIDSTQYAGALQKLKWEIIGIWGLNIAATAAEDFAQKSNGGTPQINVGSTVDNTTKPADTAPVVVQPPTPPKRAAVPLTVDDAPRLVALMIDSMARQQAMTAAKAKAQAALADTVAPGRT